MSRHGGDIEIEVGDAIQRQPDTGGGQAFELRLGGIVESRQMVLRQLQDQPPGKPVIGFEIGQELREERLIGQGGAGDIAEIADIEILGQVGANLFDAAEQHDIVKRRHQPGAAGQFDIVLGQNRRAIARGKPGKSLVEFDAAMGQAHHGLDHHLDALALKRLADALDLLDFLRRGAGHLFERRKIHHRIGRGRRHHHQRGLRHGGDGDGGAPGPRRIGRAAARQWIGRRPARQGRIGLVRRIQFRGQLRDQPAQFAELANAFLGLVARRFQVGQQLGHLTARAGQFRGGPLVPLFDFRHAPRQRAASGAGQHVEMGQRSGDPDHAARRPRGQGRAGRGETAETNRHGDADQSVAQPYQTLDKHG